MSEFVETAPICILDVSCHETLFENILTTKLFDGIIETCVFHLPSDEWPGQKITSFAGVVITGSKSCCMDQSLHWRAKLMKLITLMIKEDVPLLGICFGAQIIALTHYGPEFVGKMKDMSHEPEYGFKWITQHGNDVIFKDVPEKFKMAVSHEDCFFGMESIASTSHWKYHGFRIEGKKTWGLQFHPEFINQDAIDIFNGMPDRKVIHEGDATSDESASKQIAKNFVDQCRESAIDSVTK